MTLLTDLATDVQDADAKLVTLGDRITAAPVDISDKKRVCMLQQCDALTKFRAISQALHDVEQDEIASA